MILLYLIKAKPAKVVTPLMPCSAIEGSSAILSVKIAGYPKPEVKWYLDGLPVRNDINHCVTQKDDVVMLKISPALIDDEGIYTVKVMNALGSASCQAEFIVQCKNCF